MFFRIGVLKNFAIFTEKHLRWSLFLQAFRLRPLLKIYTNADVFLCFSIFKNSLFYRTPLVAASEHTLFSNIGKNIGPFTIWLHFRKKLLGSCTFKKLQFFLRNITLFIKKLRRFSKKLLLFRNTIIIE